MKNLELAKALLTKSWSSFSSKVSRQKSRYVSVLRVVLTSMRTFQDQTLFYVLPVKKSLNLKPVLTDQELDRVRSKLQTVIEHQKQSEESSRILEQFSGNVKSQEKPQKECKIDT